MIITSLIDNVTASGLPVEHGLSLHLELSDGRRLLFDMGQTGLLTGNAERLGVSLADVDLAVVSHGHYDHGGGLAAFLELNDHAPVYIHREAFAPHFSLSGMGLHPIGLEASLRDHRQLRFCGDQEAIDASLTLFADVPAITPPPAGNRLLRGPLPTEPDTFSHEQNLIVREGPHTVLFAGCAHRGIVNILHRATQIIGHAPTHVFAGMHLVKSGLGAEAEERAIAALAQQLRQYEGCRFFTMHCTGVEAYAQLHTHLGSQISYLACGEQVRL